MTAIVTKKFVRKPLFVDAVQVTEENFLEMARWCQGKVLKASGEEIEAGETPDPKGCYIHIRVHQPKNRRQTRAFIGDWVLYTEQGYKIYNPKSFEASFDEHAPEAVASTV